MKITVFYRSLERSNGIVSSTKDELEWRQKRGDLAYLSIEFINLDKRNYRKYLEKAKEEHALPQIIYIWYDEEVVGDYIAETYPSIKVYHFNTSCIKKEERYYGYGKAYHLLDEIVENFKKELKQEIYIIADLEHSTITVEKTDEITLHEKLISYRGKGKVVKDIDEAIALFKVDKEKNIDDLQKSIANLESELKTKKSRLKRYEKDVEKLDGLKEKLEKQYAKELKKK